MGYREWVNSVVPQTEPKNNGVTVVANGYKNWADNVRKQASANVAQTAELIKHDSVVPTVDLGALKQELDSLEGKYSQYEALKKERDDYYKSLVNKGGRGLVSGSLSEYNAKKDKKYLAYNEQLAAFGDIEKELTEKRAYYKSAKIKEEGKNLAAVADPNSENYDPEFEQYSKQGEKLADKSSWAESTKNIIAKWRNNPDLLDSWENSKDWFNGAIGESVLNNQLNYLAAKYMTDAEFAVYNYYLAKETDGLVKKGTAEEYLKAIQDELTNRQGVDIANSRDGALSKYAYGYKAGADQFTQGVINRFNSEDDYIPATGTQKASSIIREDIKDKHGIVGQIGYDMINTTSNMLPSILASVAADMIVPGSGAVVGAGLMGTSASGNAYQEMLNLGYDKKQANTYSILVGTSEAALGYAFSGISKLGGAVTDDIIKTAISGIDNGIARFAIEFGGKIASEGLEEAAQEVLTPLFENIALGYDKNSFKDINWSEVAYSGLLGMLASTGFSAVETASDMRNFKKDTSFSKQIDDVINGTHNPRYDLYVSETPKIFTDLGFTDSPLLMRNGKVNEILEKHPEMSVDTIKKIPEAIQNPILILKSKTNPTQSVVAITDIITTKGNMIVPVWIHQEGNYVDIDLGVDVVTDTNFVASAYGRNVKALIEYADQNDGFLYQSQDIEKVRQLLARNGLQLPTPLKLSDSNINISQNDNDVNNIISSGAANNSENRVLQSTAEGEEANNGRGMASFGGIDTEKGKHLTKAQQDEIRSIGEKLKRNVIYEDFYELDEFKGKKKIPDGYIYQNGDVHINFYAKRPVYFLFKHEITHYLKRSRPSYHDFMNMVMESSAWTDWLNKKGYDSVNALKADIMDTYSEVKGFNEDKCYDEMLADFVGEYLFGGENKISQELIDALEPKQKKNFLDVIKEIISYFKNKFSENARINSEIEAIEKEFIKVYNEAVNIKTDETSKNDIDSGNNISYSYYNEFTTNAMQWAYSASTKVGDKKIFSINGSGFALLKATEDGYIELAKGSYEEVKIEYERAYDKADNEVYGNSEDIRSEQGRDIWDLQSDEERRNGNRNSRPTRGKGLQSDTAGSNEHLRRGDRGKSDVDYSIPLQISAENLLESYENGEITRQEYLDMIKKEKQYNPVEIANMTEDDADTLPHRTRRKGESDGDETSKFYGSLLESSIFDDQFKDEVRLDSFIEKYKSVTNKDTLKAAAKELDEGGLAYVNKWFAIEPERASLIDTAVGFILMDRYQRIGDYESAVAAAEHVREFGTAGGQQVQIFSIIGRLDPNSMAVYAQKELSKAFETMVKGRTKKWIDKNSDRFNLTEQEIEFIRRRTLQAAQLPEGRDKAIRLAEITTLLQDKLPPKKGQAMRALQRNSMLLNVKTNIRNITGNAGMVPVFIASDFFGSGIDRMISKKTGVRTTGNFDVRSVKGFKKGFFETMDDFRRHINTRNDELNRFDIGSGKSFNENHNGILAKQLNDCAKVMNAIDRFTSLCLELGDRPFYEMWYINSLNNQLKLNKATEPTPEMMAIASTEALQRTWQDSNKMVKAVANAKEAMNNVNIGGYGLGDVMIKFTKTPANLTKAIFDFSPAGVVKAIAADGLKLKNAIESGRFEPALQKRFVDSLSKGIAGTALYIIAAGLASAGALSGGSDEDKDVSNFEKYIQGIPEYSFKLFGKWWSYDWIQPIGAIAATVTDYMKTKKENPDNEWYDNIWNAIRSGGEVLYNQSFMKSIQILFTADSFIDGLFDELLNEPSVYIPQIASHLANATDDYRRVTYEPNKPFESALNKVKLKIPGLRQTLEKQVDVFGREVKNSQGNIFDAFINPANTFTNTSTKVSDELYSLYEQTGNKTVMPRVAPYYVEAKDKRYNFSAEERNDFQRISGNVTNDILEKAFATKEYTELSDEKKIKLISKVYGFATAYAKAELEYDYEMLSAMVGEYKNGNPILTEEKYKKLSDDARKLLAQEYFLSKTEIRYDDNYDALIRYYINQVKK